MARTKSIIIWEGGVNNNNWITTNSVRIGCVCGNSTLLKNLTEACQNRFYFSLWPWTSPSLSQSEGKKRRLSAPLNMARPTLIFWPSTFITFTPIFWLCGFCRAPALLLSCYSYPPHRLDVPQSSQRRVAKVSNCLPEHKFCRVIFNSWHMEDVFRSNRKNSLFQSPLGYPVTLSS